MCCGFLLQRFLFLFFFEQNNARRDFHGNVKTDCQQTSALLSGQRPRGGMSNWQAVFTLSPLRCSGLRSYSVLGGKGVCVQRRRRDDATYMTTQGRAALFMPPKNSASDSTWFDPRPEFSEVFVPQVMAPVVNKLVSRRTERICALLEAHPEETHVLEGTVLVALPPIVRAETHTVQYTSCKGCKTAGHRQETPDT